MYNIIHINLYLIKNVQPNKYEIDKSVKSPS